MDPNSTVDVENCVRRNTSHDGTVCASERGQEVQVLLALLFVLVVVFGLYMFHRQWTSKEEEFEKATGTLNEASMYLNNLVRHFMPSLKVAKYQFRGIRPPKATVNLAFHELGLTLHSGKKVLNGVTGEFKAGRMCAIMGPSGAGKTTFMNVLSARATYGKMSGRVLVNGRNVPISSISSVTGFVPQDDIVHSDLTVREQIRFAAMLRNKAGMHPERIERITEDVLNVMQIDHIQNSIVGSVEKRGISGGQRKRVNIGLELAGQPTMLFLDEPTSGLDSTSSLAVVYSLKKMTQLGMNCIMVIHQPRYSLFTLFDDVLLLGKGGQTVYLGASLAAKDYFENLGFELPEGENRADWFMDVISGEVPNERIPNFQPKMLFEKWAERQKRHQEAGVEGGAVEEDPHTGRDISNQEDCAVLVRVIEQEWDSIDINRDGKMDASELKLLLSRVCRLEPSDEVVEEILTRMAPGEDTDYVQKGQMLAFLSSMTSDIAGDNRDGVGEASPSGHGNVVTNLIDGVAATTENVVGALGGATEVAAERVGGVAGALQRRLLERAASGEDPGSEGESHTDDDTSSDSDADRATGTKGIDNLKGLQRHLPQFIEQNWIMSRRALIMWWRQNSERAVFFFAMAIAACVLAVQDHLVGTPTWDAMSFVNTHTCLGLLVAIFCLNCFGRDQPVFWRERNRGLNVAAFYMGRANLNLIDIGMQCFLFTALYYELRRIHVGFFWYLIPNALVTWAASGWGFAVSAWVPAQHGPFIVSLIVFVVCGLLGNPMNLAQFLGIPALEVGVSLISITRWSIPMSFLMQVELTDPQYPDGSAESMSLGYYKSALSTGSWSDKYGYWWTGIFALFIYGVVLRIITYMGLVFRNRDKMV